MSEFKEKIVEALNKKNQDINTFVWKAKKVGDKQNELKMVDCTIEQLKGFYNHCESMLHNDSLENPGRYVLLDIINDQRDRCNAELFIRWIENSLGIKRFVFLNSLREFLNNNPQLDPKVATIADAVGDCPAEYEKLSIDMILNGCLDMLGRFNRRHITTTFLFKQGLWFTKEESKLMAKEKVTDKLEYAKKMLEKDKEDYFSATSITDNVRVRATECLRISPKGLSLTQMCAMVNLRSKKYSELTTLQLETLRNRILFSLDNEVMFHVRQWENRKNQILMVLKSKGVNLQ